MCIGVVDIFAGVVARRLGASPELLSVLAMAPFLGFLMAVPAGRLSLKYPWGILAAVTGILSRLLLIPVAFIRSGTVFVGTIAGFYAIQGGGLAAHGSLMKSHIPAVARSSMVK